MNCRLCSCREMKFAFTASGHDLDVCRDCGFMQVREKPSEEEIAAIYSGNYGSHGKYKDSFSDHKEFKRRVKLLDKMGVADGARILEVGCSSGDFISRAKGRYQMWGTDISSDAVENAKRSNPELADRLCSGPLETVDLPEGPFDAIVMWDVVEHLWNPVAALERLVPLLKSSGALIVSTPDKGAATARIMRSRWAFMTPPEHLCFFSGSSIRRMFESLGLVSGKRMSRGKWTTAGFVIYKLGRVFPKIIPPVLGRWCMRNFMGRMPVYVPTGDILYACARKPAESEPTGGA